MNQEDNTDTLSLDFYSGFGFFLTRRINSCSSIVKFYSCSENKGDVLSTYDRILEDCWDYPVPNEMPKNVASWILSLVLNNSEEEENMVRFLNPGDYSSCNSFRRGNKR